jgi:hypothetical protein
MSKVYRDYCEKVIDQFTDCDWPADVEFTLMDSEGAHDPCYVVMPGGALLALTHHNGDCVDLARARWIIDACNKKLSEFRGARHELADEGPLQPKDI